jgi:anti-sigma regulatory factor (Ser/Thr protein kinase)
MFYSTALPKSPRAAALARQFLEPLRREVSLDVLENARLLVSELVANAVEHVQVDDEIELRYELEDGVLRVEVIDPGPGFTPPRRRTDSDRGWGLHFVDRLASRWAIDTEGRTRVWFELLTGD